MSANGDDPGFNREFGHQAGPMGRPKPSTARDRAFVQAIRTLRGELRRMDEVPGAKDSGHLAPGRPDSEIVRGVCLRMIASFAARLTDAETRAAQYKRETAPIVRAAIDQRLMSQQALAKLLDRSAADISALKRDVRPSRLRQLQLEEALNEAAANWAAARAAQELAQVHRRRWIVLGDQIGLSRKELADAAGMSVESVRKALRNDAKRNARERDVLLRGGAATLTGGEPATAVERLAMYAVLDHVVEANPHDVSVLHAAAWFFDQHGDSRRAQAYYQRAADDRSACAAHNLGAAARIRDELDEAERWFRLADDLNHACPRATALGDLLSESGRVGEAREAWQRAAERGVSGAALKLADSFAASGDDDEEARWIRFAADRGDGVGLRRLGWALWNDGEHERARELYRRAADAGDADAACWVGRELAQRGDAGAQQYLEQASSAGHRWATKELISFLSTTNPARALSACERLERQGVEPPAGLYAGLLASVDGSVEALRRARELWLSVPMDDGGLGMLEAGVIAGMLGLREEADADLWDAVELGDEDIANAAVQALALARKSKHLSLEAALWQVANDAIDRGLYEGAGAVASVYDALDHPQEALEILRRARRATKDKNVAARLEADQAWVAVVAAEDLDCYSSVIEEALRIWTRCARRDAINAFVYLGAYYAADASNASGAEQVYRRLVELGYPYHRELSAALRGQERLDEAEETLEAGIAEGEADCFAPRGQLAADAGDYDGAVAFWRSGAAAEHWESSCLLGLELDHQGHRAEAKDILQRAAERQSSCAMNLIGTIDYKTNRRKGISQFRRAWKATCFHGAFNYALALSKSEAPGSRLERRQALEFVLEGNPGDLEAAILMAEVTAGEHPPVILPIIYEAAYSEPRAADVIRLLDPEHSLSPQDIVSGPRRRLKAITRAIGQRARLS